MLVDRDNKDVSISNLIMPNHITFVVDPDGAGKIKRVSI